MTTLTIPSHLITDLDAYARYYQDGERGCVLLHLWSSGSSMAWHTGEVSPDVAAAIAAYDPAREYVVVVIAPDPEQPGSQLVQWQRRTYGGMLVMSA